MEIADYIPNYPELNNPKFNDQIFHKKEFYDLRTSAETEPFSEAGDLWPHQKLLSRFISPHTSYNEQLLFHTPGTGKTCAAAAIVEINKQDPLIRKPVLIIVPNDTLVNQWKQQIALICTTGQYIPENYYSKVPTETLTDAEKTTRLNKLLKPVYHITTMERMRRQIDKFKGTAGDQIIRNRYSNTIIIIDEAHNLRIQTNTNKKNITSSKGRYKAFHRFFHLVVNSKILLLTGTPMFDRIGELPGLMNLILPIDKQLPIGKAFATKYLKKVGNVRKITNEAELYTYLIGRISYIREGGSFPRRVDLGKTEWTEFLKTVNVEMSELQLTGYLEAYAKDTEKGGKKKITGLWKNSRQAIVFVYYYNKQYLWGTAATELLLVKRAEKTITIKKRKITYTPNAINPKYIIDLHKNLKEYSAKYKEIVDYLLEHKNKPVFIFTPLVSGAGGAIFLGLVLSLFGYGKAIGTENYPGLRYALITGDDKSSLQRKTLIDMFNSEKNVNGEIIQVMIATKTISEGTSFTNVQDEIVVSPYWNNSGTEQAIGRGLRADSLASLPTEKRIVTVQELASTSDDLPEDQNIDAHMYKMSEAKDFEIKTAERILKKAAWDCPLNYARNVRTIDTRESRNCDYQRCNYVCYQTTPEKIIPKWKYIIPENKLDESTYLLYYSQPELLKIVEKIKNILRVYSYINVQGLDIAINTRSFKLLILAIEYIIENHVTVYNKWGQASFLRKEGNMLFLSDIPTEKEIQGSWYARYPYANQQTPLSQIINDDLLALDLPIMKNIDLSKPKKAQKLILDMNLDSKIFIFESLLKLESEQMNTKEKKLYDIFLSLFQTHIFTVNDMTFHDLEKTKLALDYVDFTKGDGGSLRCLRGNKWVDCEKKEEEELTTIIKGIKDVNTENIINNKYGVYGILTTDGKFQIADKTKEELVKKVSDTDYRTKYTGRVCGTWKKWQLIELHLRIDATLSVPIDTSIKNKTDLITEIDQRNASESIPDNATIATLQKILTLVNQSVIQLCDQLQKWFTDNDLIIKQQ
uniref:DEAD/SNF2-like helicase n=1 Tax=Marseillevirus LCMAC201 TaxID=2506605 RepID=A0A481YXH7_9VIRU|nr:MAG: DEAD/SNF2-like helicase [Marseillevirus LCMAC201]